MVGQPIATAPRDGTLILVWAEEFGPYAMRWEATGINLLVSTRPGIWVSVDKSFTWSEHHGAGPTHWSLLPA